MTNKEKKIAQAEQRIKTAKLDIMTLNSEPALSVAEMKEMDMGFLKYASLSIGIAIAFVVFF